MTTDPNPTTNGKPESPFTLPAMSDAYPLDRAERKTIDELLAELGREHERAEDSAVAGQRQR